MTGIGRLLAVSAALALLVLPSGPVRASTAGRHQHQDQHLRSRATTKPSVESTISPSLKTLTSSGSETAATERRVRKRSKWLQSTSSPGASASSSAPNGVYFSKDGSFLKRIVTEVIAERDAQIAAALFEVAKNQPHLQMMVQTLAELSTSNQRLELSSTRLDETQRRLDSRLGVISEKMTLLESRLSQAERRIEREMTQVHNKIEDVLRSIPDKSPDSLIRGIKQIQDQVNVVEEILLERGGGSNQIVRSKTRSKPSGHSTAELHKLGNSLSQAVAAAHNDLGRMIREAENNLDHQLSMLASDNGVFSCAISRLLDGLSVLSHQQQTAQHHHGERNNDAMSLTEEFFLSPLLSVDKPGNFTINPVANSIQTVDTLTFDQLAHNATRCFLKCP